MAAGDRIVFSPPPVLFLPRPPLKGTVEDAGPPESILFDNGLRQTVDSRGLSPSGPAIWRLIDPTQDEVDTWLNRWIRVSAIPVDNGQRAEGVVTDVYRASPDLGPGALTIVLFMPKARSFVQILDAPSFVTIVPTR